MAVSTKVSISNYCWIFINICFVNVFHKELEEEEKSGLDSSIEDIKPATSGEISLETPGKIQTPSYANIPGTSQDASENTPKSSDDTAFPFPQNQLTSDINSPTLPQQPQTPGDISGLVNVDPNASYATQNLQRELQVWQKHIRNPIKRLR